MDIRDRFKKQLSRNQKTEPDPKPRPEVPKWQHELLDKLAERLEDVIKRHGGAIGSANMAGSSEKTREKLTKKERARISFDDFSGILDVLKTEESKRQNDS